MLVELFGDKDGSISSMNFVWLISIVTIIGIWIALSIKLHALQHVTGGDALWFATLFSGKILQNFFEKRYPAGTSDVDKKNLGMFVDNQGRTSISRIIWVVAVLGIVFTWAYISWTSVQLQHFSTGDAAWFAGLFGSKIGGTVIESDFGIKDIDSEKYKDMMDGDTGDGDYPGLGMSGIGMSSGVSNAEKDSLIKQLQETIKVQSQFNKNLVNKIDPSIDMKKIEETPIVVPEENSEEKSKE